MTIQAPTIDHLLAGSTFEMPSTQHHTGTDSQSDGRRQADQDALGPRRGSL